ncbi:MAG: cation-translocating P-type ATPase [Deltaproteobacteria bacterium]|nr:cation-translocating P-type ATPase [Deltaproteobacteria bacterium]
MKAEPRVGGAASDERGTRREEPERARSRCARCGAALDPIRAGAVLLLDSGFVYYCSPTCKAEHVRAGDVDVARTLDAGAGGGGEIGELRRGTPASEPRGPALAEGSGRADERALGLSGIEDSERPRSRGTGEPRARLLVGASIAGLIGLGTALTASQGTWAAMVSALASSVVVVETARRTAAQRAHVGWLAWLLTLFGAPLLAVSGLLAIAAGHDGRAALAAAAIAALAQLLAAVLERRSVAPVDDAIARLLSPLPRRVRVPGDLAADGVSMTTAQIDADRVRSGEEVLVIAGEVVPVDGVVRTGEARVSLHASAAEPSRRAQGDPILAGARVVEGALRVRATRAGAERALVRVARFGEGDAPDAAPLARLAHAVTRYGAISLFAASIGAVIAFAPMGANGALEVAAAMLLAAPLTSFRRATEGPIVAGACAAGLRGIVFHDPRALERAARATVFALGSRGTITSGRPEVVETVELDGRVVELLPLAMAAESAAEAHPIALGVLRFGESLRLSPESVRRAVFVPGRGVTALAPGGETFVVGNRQLLLDEGVSVALADDEAKKAESRGRTVVFVGLGGSVKAILLLEDTVRPGARAAVQRLIDMRIESVLLAGGSRGTTEALGRELDIDHVKADMTPDERGAEVRRLRETGGVVAFAGRPGRDDAALAAADVPIVLGAAGGPAGERAIALATEDLRDAAASLWIARAARETARRTAAVVAALLTLGVLLPIVVHILAPGVPTYLLAPFVGLAAFAFGSPAGARLLRRIDLRIPIR